MRQNGANRTEFRFVSARLVTITTFTRLHEAHLAKGALEAAGIEAALVPEHDITEGSEPFRLQVREDDATAADAILNGVYGVAHAEFVRPSDEEEAAPPARCERCGSPDVHRVKKLVQFAAAAALIGTIFTYFGLGLWMFYTIVVVGVLILLRGRWLCDRCGHRWT